MRLKIMGGSGEVNVMHPWGAPYGRFGASRVDWVNEVSKHFLGTPFGGFKQSGLEREECLEELLAFIQEKNIHIRFKPA